MNNFIQLFANWINSTTDEEKIGEYDDIYILQKYDWDCGIACIEMTLKWYKRNDYLIDRDSCAKDTVDNNNENIYNTNSKDTNNDDNNLSAAINTAYTTITTTTDRKTNDTDMIKLYNKKCQLWTIELYIFLNENKINNSIMYTKNKGIDPLLFSNILYNEKIDFDINRINELFVFADRSGWPVKQVFTTLLYWSNYSIQDASVITMAKYNMLDILYILPHLHYTTHDYISLYSVL